MAKPHLTTPQDKQRSRTTPTAVVATLLLGWALALPAQAQKTEANDSAIVDGGMTEAIVHAAKRLGKAELKTDKEQEPKIEAQSDSKPYTIYFFGCQKGVNNTSNCTDIVLSAAWEGERRYTESDMNKWNRDTRFGKAYIDLDKDPVLELAINLRGGITRGNLNDWFSWWQSALKNFDQMILTK